MSERQLASNFVLDRRPHLATVLSVHGLVRPPMPGVSFLPAVGCHRLDGFSHATSERTSLLLFSRATEAAGLRDLLANLGQGIDRSLA